MAFISFPIPAGHIFTITTGEYSDYRVKGVFCALKEINPEAEMDTFKEEFPDQKGSFNFSEYRFMVWAVKKGLMEDIPCFEWHIEDWETAHANVEEFKRDEDIL